MSAAPLPPLPPLPLTEGLAPGALRLLGRASSINVRKVLWTAGELGLALDNPPWGSPGHALDAPAYVALNPNAMVPVLIEAPAGDGAVRAMWESNSICRYLAGRGAGEAAAALLPREAWARAAVEQWMDWQATELNNSWRYAFMGLVRQSPAHADPAQQAAGVTGWHRHMAILDGQLQRSGGPFVLGATFTLADVVLGLSAHRWQAAPLPGRPALPAVQAWMAQLARRPGFRRWGLDGGP